MFTTKRLLVRFLKSAFQKYERIVSVRKIVSRELENKDKYKWMMSMLNIIMSNIGGKKWRYS